MTIVVFFTAKFMMERVSLRAAQFSENDMSADIGNKHWIYASIVTIIFVVFYFLVSKEFNRIEDEHEEPEEN